MHDPRRASSASSTALLLTGGLDVDPALYGETRARDHRDADPTATRSRSRCRGKRVTRDMPVFAICRGVQVLNVAAGGSLVQDIPSAVTLRPAALDRRQPKDHVAHAVRVAPDTRLARVAGPRLAPLRHVRGEQPPPPVGRPRRARVRRLGRFRRTAWSKRSSAPRAVLRRRAVAPRELLADRRVLAAVRGVHRGCSEADALFERRNRTTALSTKTTKRKKTASLVSL